MWGKFSQFIAGAALVMVAAPALGETAINPADTRSGLGIDTLPYLQCVPYARRVSGVQLYGDAWTWWDQAEGRYRRGNRPKVGAVMAFQPHGNMALGHVAAVSKIVDSRTVLLRHANWSPINGRRGQIEDDVRAMDVSQNNDWSAVRVWFGPIQSLGSTAWPVSGFIYNEKPGARGKEVALAAKSEAAPRRDVIAEIIAASESKAAKKKRKG
ncbi:CHAP domain-containing protein [Altererythrobacter sp. CC-YST694]|uniref:CHAP domain-containing protein n=1 Tax=Altererythrobacter sp. CC-YST694 TaxID=2755038 RepID=UPI001D0271EA|nr:CHAP domain-containing protein [Altererythrobacter sp. CC-YST694]